MRDDGVVKRTVLPLLAAALLAAGCTSEPAAAPPAPAPSPTPTATPRPLPPDPRLLPAEGGSGAVVVGATPTLESRLVAQAYAQALSHAGYAAEVVERPDRLAMLVGLQDGSIDLAPDYVGSLGETINRGTQPAGSPAAATGDVAATTDRARALAAGLGLTVLDPSPAADENGFAVTRAFAEANGLTALSGLADVPGPLVLGGTPECAVLSLCLPGLEAVYGVDLTFVATALGGAEGAAALEAGTVQVQQFLSTDPVLVLEDLVLLADDRRLSIADNLVPVVGAARGTDELLRSIVGRVTAALSTGELRALNARMLSEGTLPTVAARDFLEGEVLLPV